MCLQHLLPFLETLSSKLEGSMNGLLQRTMFVSNKQTEEKVEKMSWFLKAKTKNAPDDRHGGMMCDKNCLNIFLFVDCQGANPGMTMGRLVTPFGLTLLI